MSNNEDNALRPCPICHGPTQVIDSVLCCVSQCRTQFWGLAPELWKASAVQAMPASAMSAQREPEHDWKLRARVADLVHLLPAEIAFLEGDRDTGMAALADVRAMLAEPSPQMVAATPACWHIEVLENDFETRLTLWGPEGLEPVSFAVDRASAEAVSLRAYATACDDVRADDEDLLPVHLPGQLATDVSWQAIDPGFACDALNRLTIFSGDMLLRGWNAMRQQILRQAEEERQRIKAQVWKRDSTQEWVLELSGTLDGQYFVVRHTEPLDTARAEVPGLPTLYARLLHLDNGDIAQALQEASEVLQAVAPAHQPANWRGPLVDELAGFAGLLKKDS